MALKVAPTCVIEPHSGLFLTKVVIEKILCTGFTDEGSVMNRENCIHVDSECIQVKGQWYEETGSYKFP